MTIIKFSAPTLITGGRYYATATVTPREGKYDDVRYSDSSTGFAMSEEIQREIKQWRRSQPEVIRTAGLIVDVMTQDGMVVAHA